MQSHSATAHTSIEPLEPRIAPAAVTINAALKTATWTDYDGDLVTMKWTGTNAPAFSSLDTGLGVYVDKITFTQVLHEGVGFGITVKATATGDGYVELGRIDATSTDLGVVSAPKVGVLEFDAGSNSAITPAVKSLTLGGIGNVTGLFTGGGNGVSAINGGVGKFTVMGNIGVGTVDIGSSAVKTGPVKIGGSLRGDFSPSVSGQLLISGKSIGPVTIGGDIIGGSANGSGKLFLDSPAPSVVIKGSIIGGTGDATGEVRCNSVNAFTLGGNLVGGSGYSTAGVSLSSAKMVTIGGSVVGGSGSDGANVFISSGPSKVLIKGSIIGGQIVDATADYASMVQTNGSFSSFTIKGDLIAGSTLSGVTSYFNGAILSFGPIGVLNIAGSVVGNDQTHALIIASKVLAKPASGLETVMGSVKIGRNVAFADILAGYSTSTFPGYATAVINGDAGIGSITVGGSWFHTSAMAGVQDTGQNGPSTNDVRPAISSAEITARIGSIVIKGTLTDSSMTSTFSGIQAEQIGKIIAAGRVLYKTGDGTRFLGASGNTFAREV